MKRILALTLLALALAFSPACAQKKVASADYKLQKAYDVLNEENDTEKALDLLDEVIDEIPDYVGALLLRGRVLGSTGEYGKALADFNAAIKVNKPKKTGIFNSTLHGYRAQALSDLDREEEAAVEYKLALGMARKDNPAVVQDVAFDYSRCLFLLKRYDEAEIVLKEMLRDDETDVEAMAGLALVKMQSEQYEEVVKILDKSEKYDAEYGETYRLRMDAYDKLGEKDKAIDQAIMYFEKDEDPDLDRILEVFDKHYNYALVKVKSQIKMSEHADYWRFILCCLYEDNRDYVQAIKEYDALEKEFGKSHVINERRSDCYDNLGLIDRAIEDITAAISEEQDANYLLYRGDYFRKAGMYEEAITDFTAAMEEMPDDSFLYYRRGWCYELSGDKEKALEDYNMGIDIDQNYPYLYLMRGEMYLDMGENEKAAADFEQIIQNDTVANDGSCRQYALHFLGRDDEAAEWMDKVIADYPDEPGNWYDKACLYSRMGRLDEAVDAIKKAFSMGYRAFGHLEHDDDLDAIRDREDFKAAVEAAKADLAAQLKKFEIEVPKEEGREVEVAMLRRGGGTFEVSCAVNGLPLDMIFDTGASDVSISSVEANFMLKNKYLSEKDIKGKAYYQTANGEISEGTTITLKEVKIGDAVLKNVDASVVKNQKAPLLLGQSVMERFGTITIDNINSKLIIKQ